MPRSYFCFLGLVYFQKINKGKYDTYDAEGAHS